MNSQIESRAIQRYIALDIHKEYVMIGVMMRNRLHSHNLPLFEEGLASV